MSNISNLEDYRTPTPSTKNSKVINTRKYKDVREREYLTSSEIERISKAAKSIGRHDHRDSTIIIIAYHHALRVSELVNLKWSQVDLSQGQIHVNRLKNGVSSVHPLSGHSIRALRKLKRDYPDTPYTFITERKGPLVADTVRKMVKRAGEKAGLPFPIHPHMLRHSTGFKLANDQQDTRAIQHYMGHKNIPTLGQESVARASSTDNTAIGSNEQISKNGNTSTSVNQNQNQSGGWGFWDSFQAGLDVVRMIPVVGEVGCRFSECGNICGAR